ncbi:nicotinamide-nucleotide adenylyltransferase [Candidatus Woesearchaeota archaeon]|nr:nicotinamide-nucleotide adenylyltransferase [Candidatus Woesearchaeota archaeon]
MKTALFIGRFQPFHNAHLSDVKLALRECGKVIIAIGSSQESGTKDNPFAYEERKDMISSSLRFHKIQNYDIVPVPDINDDSRWVGHVRKAVPPFSRVYTGNRKTERLFREKGIDVRRISLIPLINATEIRKRMLHGGNWKELVPKEVSFCIEKMGGVERIKRINDREA